MRSIGMGYLILLLWIVRYLSLMVALIGVMLLVESEVT